MLDDTLQAVGPGHYRATFQLPKGGAYEVVLSGVQPRFAACAPLELPTVAQPSPGNRAPSLAVRLVELLADERAGGVWVRAQLVDANGQASQTALTDLTLLAFDRRSGWQTRRPMRATASGLYEALLEAPEGAQLDLRAGSVAGDLSFQAGGLGDVQVSNLLRVSK
jgi:hypothetical protein